MAPRKSFRARSLVSRIKLYFALLVSAGLAPAASLEPSQLLILVNRDVPISHQVAQMYSKARSIPTENILELPMGSARQISDSQYWTQIGEPLKQYLDAHRPIRCVLTTAGVPYTIRGAGDKDPGAALDNELAGVLRNIPGEPKRRQRNLGFAGGANLTAVLDPRLFQMVYVARLDGPDLKTITRMVDDAIATEQSGLEGPVFGDAQGLDLVTGQGLGDASIRAATDLFSDAGFPATLDMKPESWKQPPGGPGQQAAGAAFYLGWYDLNHFQNIFGKGLARGSIAWHIASQEAQDIWSEQSTGWCVNLLRHGAAVTLGPVSEPYLDAFPHGNIFTEALLSGRSVVESYWLALPHISWQMVLLGDPLYAPFSKKPRPALVARAYVAANSSGVLQAGQSGAMHVMIECVGPPGSSTPALTATIRPESGLADASGSISIPALKAGETAEVTIPKLTAGSDPSGMFRLHFDAQDAAGNRRSIVLEGRTGFARLTPGVLSKLQMFLSPDSNALISGRPGESFWVDTTSLAIKSIRPPDSFAVASAAFSPDSQHVELSMTNAVIRQTGFFLADKNLANPAPLPDSMVFIKWLDAKHILGLKGSQVVNHSIADGTDTPLPYPADEAPKLARGGVVPGTGIVFLITSAGNMSFGGATQPFTEVLRGTHAVKDAAIANDLSLFGGVDSRNRLWLQRGVSTDAEILANNVDHVVWGPVSHRALVVDDKGKGRVYDARDRSWLDLGTVGAAQWSSDEKSLLFSVKDGASEAGSLSLLMPDKSIRRLCDLSRIGSINQIELSADARRAFLLASLSGQLEVWEIALPASAAN